MFGKDNNGEKKGGDVIGFIGKGMTVEGKLSFNDTVKIDGNFKGEIISSGTLVIGESGYVNGEVKVGGAVITGELKGSLDASSRVELRAPAKLFGDIKTPNLLIGEGVVFEGNCIMVKREKAPERAPSAFSYGEKAEKVV
ncbi:MAG: polymer-forming cytoskeletal protein [Thermodesulfobacteriota bacterium]